MGRELRRAGGGRYKGTAGSKHRDPKREREMGRNGRHRDRKRGRDWRGSTKKILRDGGEEKIERDGEIDT